MREQTDTHGDVRGSVDIFEVQDVVSGGRHTLILRGEMDLQPAAELEGLLERICAAGASAIVIDLGRLTFIGSTGLRTILKAKDLCEQSGCDFAVVPGPRNVQRLFELTGLNELLPVASGGAASV